MTSSWGCLPSEDDTTKINILLIFTTVPKLFKAQLFTSLNEIEISDNSLITTRKTVLFCYRTLICLFGVRRATHRKIDANALFFINHLTFRAAIR